MYRRFSHRVHLPQLQQDDTSLFHFTIAVKELNSLSKVLVVDELIRRQTLARPAALSPAVVVVSFFTAQFLQAGAQQQAVFTTRLGTSPQMEHLSGEIVPPLEHPLS